MSLKSLCSMVATLVTCLFEMAGQHQLWKEKESGFISGGEVKF
jgi:hypothetical protein